MEGKWFRWWRSGAGEEGGGRGAGKRRRDEEERGSGVGVVDGVLDRQAAEPGIVAGTEDVERAEEFPSLSPEV